MPFLLLKNTVFEGSLHVFLLILLTMNENKNSFVKGAAVLSLGGLVAKIIGACYRIPLTNLLGSYGMGVYQLIFPLYALLLTISSAGIPVAISKLVSENIQLNKPDQAHKVFRTALLFLTLLGLAGTALLYFSAPYVSALQGSADAAAAYRLISPSVLLVCIISAYRGYFQGNLNMVPTAISQVVEQTIKMALALSAVIFLAKDVLQGVYLCALAVTVSELVAAVVLAITYFFKKDKPKLLSPLYKTERLSIAKKIFLLSVPITISGIVLPLTQFIDSMLVINLLKTGNATELFGLWSGPVHSLLNMPVVLTLGIATAAIPSLSRIKVSGDKELFGTRVNGALKFTMLIALPCTIGLCVLALPISRLLYGRLPDGEILLISQLLQTACLSVLFLSVVQTTTSVLHASGKMYVPVAVLGIATAVKTVLNIILLSSPQLNIFGAAISSVVCYLVAATANLLYIIIKLKLKVNVTDVLVKPIACTLVMSVGLLMLTVVFKQMMTGSLVWLIAAIGLSAVIFAAAAFALKVFDKSEIAKMFNKGRKNEKSKDTSFRG